MQIPAVIRQKSTDWVLQFINIVFLLLLYFLVNGAIVEIQRPDIAMPLTVAGTKGLPPNDAVYVDKNGTVFFRGAEASASGVAAKLDAGGSREELTIVADKSLPAVRLVAILKELRSPRLGQITLVTVNQVSH